MCVLLCVLNLPWMRQQSVRTCRVKIRASILSSRESQQREEKLSGIPPEPAENTREREREGERGRRINGGFALRGRKGEENAPPPKKHLKGEGSAAAD